VAVATGSFAGAALAHADIVVRDAFELRQILPELIDASRTVRPPNEPPLKTTVK
jgi:hypothetical protein